MEPAEVTATLATPADAAKLADLINGAATDRKVERNGLLDRVDDGTTALDYAAAAAAITDQVRFPTAPSRA